MRCRFFGFWGAEKPIMSMTEKKIYPFKPDQENIIAILSKATYCAVLKYKLTPDLKKFSFYSPFCELGRARFCFCTGTVDLVLMGHDCKLNGIGIIAHLLRHVQRLVEPKQLAQ